MGKDGSPDWLCTENAAPIADKKGRTGPAWGQEGNVTILGTEVTRGVSAPARRQRAGRVRIKAPLKIRPWAIVSCTLAGLACGAAITVTAPNGLDVAPDATVYIAAARNLLQGNDLISRGQAMTHFPPGYSYMLALNGLVTGDPYRGAVAWNALCYALTIALAGLIAYVGSRGSGLAMAAGLAITICARHMFPLHQGIVSEPPFFVCLMACAYTLGRYVSRPRMASLLLAGAAIAIAMMVRYAGASMLAPAVLLVLLSAAPLKSRLLRAGILTVTACLPLGVWLVHNYFAYDTATHRPLALHLVNARDLMTLAKTVTAHYFPRTGPLVRVSLLALPMLAFTVRLVRSPRPSSLLAVIRRRPLVASLLMFAAGYLLFVMAAKSLMDASISFEIRMIMPFNLLVALAGTILLLGGSARMKRGIFAGVAIILAVVALNVRELAAEPLTNSGRLVYAGQAWREAPGIRLAGSMSPGTLIYSDSADAIEFLTGRPARMLPQKYSPLSTLPNPDAARELARIRQQVLAHEAVVILFKKPPPRPYLLSHAQVQESLAELHVAHVPGADLYGWPGAAEGAVPTVRGGT